MNHYVDKKGNEECEVGLAQAVNGYKVINPLSKEPMQ